MKNPDRNILDTFWYELTIFSMVFPFYGRVGRAIEFYL